MVIGPILYFNGAKDATWEISIFYYTQKPLKHGLTIKTAFVPAYYHKKGYHFWRGIKLRRREKDKLIVYKLNGHVGSLVVPRRDSNLRIMFINNGAYHNKFERPLDWEESWKDLQRDNYSFPYHLIIHGGGQIYMDDFRTELFDSYFVKYREIFNEPVIAQVLATTPSLMLWDSADIMVADREIPQSIFDAANTAYNVFQMCLSEREYIRNNSRFFGIGKTAILLLDAIGQELDEGFFSQMVVFAKDYKRIFICINNPNEEELENLFNAIILYKNLTEGNAVVIANVPNLTKYMIVKHLDRHFVMMFAPCLLASCCMKTTMSKISADSTQYSSTQNRGYLTYQNKKLNLIPCL